MLFQRLNQITIKKMAETFTHQHMGHPSLAAENPLIKTILLRNEGDVISMFDKGAFTNKQRIVKHHLLGLHTLNHYAGQDIRCYLMGQSLPLLKYNEPILIISFNRNMETRHS